MRRAPSRIAELARQRRAQQKQFTKLPKTILLGIGYKGIQILKAGRKVLCARRCRCTLR